jgi:hypothetical protein
MSTFTPTIQPAYSGTVEAGLGNEPTAQAVLAPSPMIRDADGRSLRLDSAETAREIVTALSVLAKSAVAELRLLSVDESDQTIHLSGRVRSFYHKQLAQEAIRPIAAGRQVVNRVDVCERA